MSVGERFDRGDVQVGKERLPVGVEEGHEHAPLAEGNRVRIANFACVSARQMEAGRLEGFASQQFSDFVRVHTASIPFSPARVDVR